MTDKVITRLLSDCAPGDGMKPMGYISAETFKPGDAFTIPRGFNGLWQMTERYKNFFVTVEPEE